MENELYAVLSSLPKAGSSVAVGPLAQRMLAIVRAIHGQGFIIRDVKPENFMIAPGTESIVDRVRLVDLGMLKTYRDFAASGHAPNDGTNGLAGTPLYASLNAHTLQTPSRRDDVEALLYLLGEIVICLNAAQQGKTARWKNKGSFLPWSNGKSDEEIGELKEAQVLNIRSEYYSRMPEPAAQTLKQCLDEVRSYAHRKEPNYDLLNGMLSSLNVPASSKRVAKKRPSPSKARPAHRSPRLSTRRSHTRYNLPDCESDEMSISDGVEDAVPMDIDNNGDNQARAPTKATQPSIAPKKNRKFCAAILVAKEGPLKGQQWVIQEGKDAKWVIGKNPSKPGYKPFVIDDDSVDKTHAQIELVESTSSLRLHVWDLKSKEGTFVGGCRVPASKTARAVFAGSMLHFGNVRFDVRRAPNSARVAEKGRSSGTYDNEENRAPAQTKATPPPAAVLKKNRKFCAAILVAKEGPFKGQQWVIQEGEDAKWVIGKNPSKPGYKPFVIDDDSVDKTHAQIELVESTSSLRLHVWDLKSKEGTFVGGCRVPPSKTARAVFADSMLHFGDVRFEVRRAPN